MKNIIFILLLAGKISFPQGNIFDFKPDERLFISYAFMNAAGNDAEWRKEGMDSIRIEVRNYLKKNIDSTFLNKINKYVFDNHLESWSNYGPYALINDGPPDFKININYKTSGLDSSFVEKVEGLRPYFIEFYKKYNIEELWKQYRDVLKKENLKYRPYAANALKDITNYCRIDKNYFSKISGEIYYQNMPLMSYFTAQTIKVNNIIYIISGPSDGLPSESSFYHEALHHPVGELVGKYSELIDKYSRINRLNKGKMGYAGWNELFEECLVRTITKRMTAGLFNWSNEMLTKQINNEYKLGMILCPFFNKQMQNYESSDKTLEEYFPTMIRNLNYEREEERLREFKE